MNKENGRETVDFHVHYTDETAERILTEAARKGVVAVALIGRGEVSDRIEDFQRFGSELGIDVISGTELLVTAADGSRVDVLCLGFDRNDPGMRRYFGIRENIAFNASLAREQREFLENSGFVVDGVDEEGGEVLSRLEKGLITAKAIRFCWLVARNPVNKDLVNELKIEDGILWHQVRQKYENRNGYRDDPNKLTAKFLWLKYFDVGKPGHKPIHTKVKEIIEAVHEAGGIVLYSPEGEYREETFRSLIEDGVDGIMGWHGKEFELSRSAVALTNSNELLILGGSDYDPGKNEWRPGDGNGQLYMSPRRLQELREYMKR